VPADVRRVRDLAEIPPGPLDRLEVAYFHRTHRSAGCLKAEELTRKTLDTWYADRLASGEMILLVEDMQQPADPELVRRYDPYGSSIYLGLVKAGITYVSSIEDVWFVLSDETQFTERLRGHIDAALEGL
jgi:hypothetical protein